MEKYYEADTGSLMLYVNDNSIVRSERRGVQ